MNKNQTTFISNGPTTKARPHQDNQYINIVIDANKDIAPDNTPAYYDETLSNAILYNPSEYYCSIIRFSVPLDLVPIFQFKVDVRQNNPIISNYVIGIKYLGVEYPEKVALEPSSNTPAPVPSGSAPFFNQAQVTSSYYNIFSISSFINMINTALIDSVAASGLILSFAPYYIYNPVTELISLVIDNSFLTSGAEIFMNVYMKQYLSSFNLFFDVNTKSQDYLYYHVLTPFPPNSPVGGPYTYSEDFISIGQWFTLRKLFVTTTSIPINTEVVPAQTTTGSLSGTNNFVPIITDFIIDFNNNTSSIISTAVYNATAQYRLVDMTSNSPLQKINLQFFYEDDDGNQFPIFISPGNQVTCKIGFFKKYLYSNSLYDTAK